MNNIDHLKALTILSLPTLLKFDKVQKDIEETYDDQELSKIIRQENIISILNFPIKII